jgi:hypothetical protein
MKQVEYHLWFLPGKTPRSKPYLSRWKMTAEDAAKLGAIRPEPTSLEVRDVPETEDDRLELMRRTNTAVHAARQYLKKS